ncbi:hypothetical protein BDA99DRAFT_528958 [Phascolomyces articulosus]|uniref:Uncharacterized protein n=1 Tax=Phascolomyces articulosus TaxID=60185 RepID=A0AAD5JL88_9FUNG|nr:hypothetical protein BDA99DRAFT_528958 [Phascolomyces articulosus]
MASCHSSFTRSLFFINDGIITHIIYSYTSTTVLGIIDCFMFIYCHLYFILDLALLSIPTSK